MKLPEDFQISYWENGEFPTLPAPPDRYRRGHITMGCDVDRGLAIQAARGRKQRATNEAFFFAEIYPQVRAELTPADVRNLANQFPMPQKARIFADGGFVLFADTAGRSAWIHPATEPDKVAQALGLGATQQPAA